MTAVSVKKRTVTHRIYSVDFSRARAAGLSSAEAPLNCECSWTGQVAQYQDHRNEVGAYNKYGQQIRPTDKDETPWRRTGRAAPPDHHAVE